MTARSTTMAWLLAALLLAPACGAGSGSAQDGGATPAPDAAGTAAGTGDEAADLQALDDIPTMEALDARMQAEVSDENADETFERLAAELEAEDDG